MDEMRLFLSKHDVNKAVLFKLGEYVADEQYDTDSLKADIETIGNVDENCRSKKLIESIEEFIKATAGYVSLCIVCLISKII